MLKFYREKVKKHLPLVLLLLFCLGVFFVSLKINIFRYNNFDLGKFDLGNMTQMVWNTLHGKFMYLTDYFGTNLPRWAMSHVDPILLLVVPFFVVWQHPLTLVIFQLVLVIVSSFLIYAIAKQKLNNDFAALFFALAFLFYPAVGFVLAWTAFHGVTIAIPFFLASFYLFEKMYKNRNFSSKQMVLFWTLLVITMSGKEEIPLFVFMFGLFILLFRNVEYTNEKEFLTSRMSKLSIKMMVVSVIWFVMAFFVIIPAFSSYRVEGYKRFAANLGISEVPAINITESNYFLGRYEGFGDSYSEIILNMALRPRVLTETLFNGDKPENMQMTFAPMLYSPLLYPPLFALALPELIINYSITGGGIGTSEIYNHRISMIIPVLFIASIYGVGFMSRLISKYVRVRKSYVTLLFSFVVLVSNIYTTFDYENPIYLWLTQAIQKRIPMIANAREIFEEDKEVLERDLEIGERFRLAKFERKDRECARKFFEMIPDEASISGPDYLGAHLAKRETYAIFPALYNSADIVVVDVFARKVVELLDINEAFINEIVGRLLKNEDYKLRNACGNLFVFEKVGKHGKSKLLPMQEVFEYPEKVSLEIFKGLHVVDYALPDSVNKGEPFSMGFAYTRKSTESLGEYVLFTTFVNKSTGEVYQLPNLPSFALSKLDDWNMGIYYLERNEVVFPDFLESGNYMAFVGISNNIRTRSIYLGSLTVQ